MQQYLRALSVLLTVVLVVSCHGGSGGGALPPVGRSRQATSSTPPSATQWTSGANFAPATIAVSWPSAPAVGDVLVVAFWNNGQSTGAANTYTPPAGWTTVDQNTAHAYTTYEIFTHVVGAGEPNSYVFTPLAAQREQLWIGADVANASGVDQRANAYVASGTVFTTPSVTPSQPSDLALAFNVPVTSNAATWTNPQSWTLGTGPTSTWHGEALYQSQSSNTPVSESATVSTAVSGFAGIVLLAPSGAQSTPTPAPTGGGTSPSPSQWSSGSKFAPASITVSWAAPPAVGDVLIVAFWNNGQSTGAANTYTPPAGWTTIDQNTAHAFATYQAFTHVVVAGETNSYAFTPLAAQRQHVWIAGDVGGASSVEKGANAFIASGTTYTTPTVTPNAAADLAIAIQLPFGTSTATWTNPQTWTLGTGPTSTWKGESLYEGLSTTSPVSESSTLSASATGFSAIVLVAPSGVQSTPTPASTATPTPVPTGGGTGPSPSQWTSGSAFAPATIGVKWSAAPAVGDMLVVAFWNNGQSGGAANTYTPPAGWTAADSNTAPYATYEVFWHVVSAGETNSYQFTPLTAQRQHVWIGADVSGAMAVDRAADRYVSSSMSFTTPSVTPLQSGDLAVAFNLSMNSSATWSNQSSWTVGIGPTTTWHGESLYQPLSSTSSISESATLSAASSGFAGIVLLSANSQGTPAPAASPVDWSTFGYDLQRTGYNPNESTITTSNVATLHPMWFTLPAVGTQMQGEPALAMNVNVGGSSRNLLYAGATQGVLYAIDADTGSVVWSKQLGTGSYTCPGSTTAANWGVGGAAQVDRVRNLLYVPDGANNVHALDLGTGAEAAGWPVSIAPVTSHDFIHVAMTYNANNGLLYAGTSSMCDISPWFGRIVAIDTSNASLLRTFYPNQGSSGGSVWGVGGASIDPSTNYVFIAVGNADAKAETANYSEHIVELSADLSTVIASNYPTNMPPMVDSDFGSTPTLFQPLGCPPLLTALNKSGAFVLYDRTNIGAGPIQEITMANTGEQFRGVASYDPVTNFVYVGLPDSHGIYVPGVAAFSITASCTLNPTPAWNGLFGSTSGDLRSPITIANGVLYVAGANEDMVFAYDAATGAQLWTGSLGNAGRIGPIVASGRLYVGDFRGVLHAWAP